LLEIKVCEVRGHCPVYKVGDKITIDDPEIVLEKTNALCTHALSSLLHYVVTLERGADPVELGLSKPNDRAHAYIQCVDPGEPYTKGGTVVFKIGKVGRAPGKLGRALKEKKEVRS
jgi:uncharacterized repeat protein (TIGR04076 family)